MRIFFDPNFVFNELIEYHAPVIIQSGEQSLVDLHSLSIINFLGIVPIAKGTSEIDDLILYWMEFPDESVLDLQQNPNIIELNEENFEKFKISNHISLKHLQHALSSKKRMLKIENSVDNLYMLVSLCTEYVLQNREFFEDKKFEVLLEIMVFFEIKRLTESYNLTLHMPQPFLFQIDLSKTSYGIAYKFVNDVEKLSGYVTSKVAELFSIAKEKIRILDKLFSSVDRKSFTKLIYTFSSVDEIISDLRYLKDLVQELESCIRD